MFIARAGTGAAAAIKASSAVNARTCWRARQGALPGIARDDVRKRDCACASNVQPGANNTSGSAVVCGRGSGHHRTLAIYYFVFVAVRSVIGNGG